MAINVKCPGCGSRASVADQHAGKAIRCKNCGGRITVALIAYPEAKITPNTGPGAVSEETPKKIGGFEVRRVLGAGAFGTVYLGHDRTLDRPVALKVPHPHTFTTSKARKRFETEARAVAQLRHPHIVPIYSAGFDGAHYFIASQFIAGPAPKSDGLAHAMTLEEAVEKEGGLAFQNAARIVHDLAEALVYAHELGIVHRDVKPANVLLDEQGRAHLADFGLAHQESSAEKLTHDGAILGTPAYMAPEQAKGREGDVLPASDQYSLRIVLYELLTGKAPFSGPVGLVLSLHQNEEVKPPHKVRPGVPLDLETICLKALEKDPARRYASCGEMAADLGRWLEGEPIRARRMGFWERSWRWGKRNPVVAGLTAAVAASLLLGAVVAMVLAARATQQERLATAAAENAKRNEAAAIEQKDKAEYQVYMGHIIMAQRDWQDDFVAEAWQHLNACKKDLRGWEYDYLKTQFTRRQQTFSGVKNIPLCLGPDGKRLASGGGADGTVWVWDAERGQELLTLNVHSAAICASFSPDGKRLACGGIDGKVRICDTERGGELLTITAPGGNGPVQSVGFSPDGKRLACDGGDGKASGRRRITRLSVSSALS